METYHIVIDNNFWDLNFQTIVSLIILLASLYISYKGNQTAQDNVEKTIKANREEMREENLLQMKKEWLNEVINIGSRISELFFQYEIHVNQQFFYSEKNDIMKTKEVLKELFIVQDLLFMKIDMSEPELVELTTLFKDNYKQMVSYAMKTFASQGEFESEYKICKDSIFATKNYLFAYIKKEKRNLKFLD